MPVAYWILKVVTVLMSLAFIGLVGQCARALGRDPRFAIVFVAANPIFLMYAIPGFHNDFFMLVPMTAAVALLLSHRDRSAGAMVMVAIAVKFTAGLLLPFLLIAARPNIRRRRIIEGCLIAGDPAAGDGPGAVRLRAPEPVRSGHAADQLSFPNLFGLVVGLGGGTPGVLRLSNVAVVIVVALLIRRRRDWLSGAGWATFALILSLAWLVPWYVVWLLPLAALSTNLRLRQAALGLTVFLVLTFMPVTDMFLFEARHQPARQPCRARLAGASAEAREIAA